MIARSQSFVASVPPLTLDLPVVSESISPYSRMWPLAGLVAAMIVNLAWMGFL
jgi:hypothetical protein